MSCEPLDLLVVLSDAGAAAAIAAALRRRGHAVWVAEHADQVDRATSASTALCELDALERLRERGIETRAIVVDVPEDPQSWRRALQLGAADALGRPWRIAELVAAVENGAPTAALPASLGATLKKSFAAEADAIDAALGELCAFLVLQRIAPSTRARALTATAELLENCARHAYPPPPARGSIQLEAHVRPRELEIAVCDRGRGFEPAAAHADGGLARAAVLAEDLQVASDVGQGTRAALRFSALRVEFDEGADVDLSDHDWLSPALARRVLASLGDGQAGPFYSFSPALAVTVGRLLAGATEKARIERALWSSTGGSTGRNTGSKTA
jgi:anti-sigma regulatory factor (Ser/Thr protein kinase)